MVKSGLLGIDFDGPSFQYLFSSLLGFLKCVVLPASSSMFVCNRHVIKAPFPKVHLNFQSAFTTPPTVVVAVNQAAFDNTKWGIGVPGGVPAAHMPFRASVSNVTTTGFELECSITTRVKPVNPVPFPRFTDPLISISYIACGN
jgi:hypothetical protein